MIGRRQTGKTITAKYTKKNETGVPATMGVGRILASRPAGKRLDPPYIPRFFVYFVVNVFNRYTEHPGRDFAVARIQAPGAGMDLGAKPRMTRQGAFSRT
jgi:hypothetical protein